MILFKNTHSATKLRVDLMMLLTVDSGKFACIILTINWINLCYLNNSR